MGLWGNLGIDFYTYDLMVDGYMVSYVCLCLVIYVLFVFLSMLTCVVFLSSISTYPPFCFFEIIVFVLLVYEVEIIKL